MKKIKLFSHLGNISRLENQIKEWIKDTSPEILGLTMTGEKTITIAIIYKQ